MRSSPVYVAASSPDLEPKGKSSAGDRDGQHRIWLAAGLRGPVRRRVDRTIAHGGLTRGQRRTFSPWKRDRPLHEDTRVLAGGDGGRRVTQAAARGPGVCF